MLGRRHPTLQRLRALRKDPAARRRAGVLFAEGLHLAREALAAGATIEQVVVDASIHGHPEGPALLEALTRHGVPVDETSPAVLAGLQDARSPQPLLSVVRLPDEARAPLDADTVLVAAGVQDPGNLGAMLRTAEAAGAGAMVQLAGGADPYHPRAVRASAGSVFRVRVRVREVEGCLAEIVGAGLVSVGAVPRDGTPLARFEWPPRTALFVGGEGGGLPDAVLRALERRVTVPMAGSVESLSVGAAAAVLLFDRRRRSGRGSI